MLQHVRFWLKTIVDVGYLVLFSIYAICEEIYRFLIPNPPKSLAGETILITGSGNGIGKEICLQLAKSGARLICWDLNKRNNDQVVKELRKQGALAYAYEVDISRRSQVETVADMVKRDVGDVTIIINNAGIGPCKEFLKYSPEDLEDTFKVNVLAQFWILREFLPKMIEFSKGHIVTTCSIAGLKANRYMVPYHGSKFAVHGYLESLNDEIRHHPNKPDIKFTTVYPTAVNTNLIDGIRFGFRFPSLTPVLNPEDVAEKLIDGLRRNKQKVFCPSHLSIFIALEKFLPNKIQAALTDFLMQDFCPDENVLHVPKAKSS